MNRKNIFKTGLGFGIVMAIFFILQDVFTNDNLTSEEILKSIASGIIGGIVAGSLFGWLMGLFGKSKFINETTMIDTDPGEEILFQTAANHFKGLEGVGGKLYLTNKRLIFKSHQLNIQNHQLSISLPEIEAAGRYKTLGLVNNGLAITTKQNTTEKFVVDQVEEWLKHLTGRKNGL